MNAEINQHKKATRAEPAFIQTHNKAIVFILPVVVLLLILLIWWLISVFNLFPAYALPTPSDVLKSFREEIVTARLYNDIIASLWRVAVGFVLSAGLGIPLGLWLGQHLYARHAFLPILNFFRFLSPLAWIPFAILWFHTGDKPPLSLQYLWQLFFPLVISTMSAVATIPGIYFRVAHDYNYKGIALITKVTPLAVLPQVVTSLVCKLWYRMGGTRCG